MKRKVWEITVLDNPNRAIGGENDQFYTTDTEAFLIFNLADENFSPTEAMLTLVNSADRSVISETVPVVGGTIEWEMREEIIEHAGNWQAQLVYKQMKDGKEEKYTSQIVTFSVSGHLLDTREAGLVAIENWNNFANNAKDLFADWEDLEEIRQLNEEQRIINEEARQENYNELVDTGIMQENINQKLADAEQEYAPRLTELEQNDADLTAQLAQSVKRGENESISKEMLSREIKEEINNGEIEFILNTSEIEDGAITEVKTSFLKRGKNLFNKEDIVQGEIVNQTNGEIVKNETHWRTKNFIKITPGQLYTISPHHANLSRIAFYSERDLGSFISGDLGNQTNLAPQNANYAMISSSFDVNLTQLELGSEPSTHEEYMIVPTFKAVTDNSITNNKIKSKAITANKTDFIITSKNLFTKEGAREGWVRTAGGWSENSNYTTTKPIEVEPDTYYRFSEDIVQYHFLDPDGERLRGGVTTAEKGEMYSGLGATHLMLSMTNSRWNRDGLQLEEGTEVTSYVPHSKKLSSEIEVGISSENNRLNGKHILFIGDSNTHVNTWPQQIADRTGAITYNGGMGATRLLDQSSPEDTYLYNHFNGCAVADALATGDFSELDHYGALLDAEINNSNPDYLDQIQNIKDAYSNISDLDSIFISYGTNDVNNNASYLGEVDSFDRSTWCGAINYITKTIGEAHPHIKVFFATPPFRAKMSGTEDTTSDEGVTGKLYMPEMSKKMLEITSSNHQPCLDLYFKAGINQYTASRYLKNLAVDGTHYNSYGEEHVSWLYQRFLENN